MSRSKETFCNHRKIQKLFGHDYRTKYILFCVVATHLWCSTLVTKISWLKYLLMVYLPGATCTQAIFLGIHECAHGLTSKSMQTSRIHGMCANFPLVFPMFSIFQYYHLRHHSKQDVYGEDPDLPTKLEQEFVKSKLGKFVWLSLQIVIYSLRPLMTVPLKLNRFMIYNFVLQTAFVWVWIQSFGIEPVKYLVLCIMVSGGLHPCSGHFLSEHYPPVRGPLTQTTFSYYGPLNYITWNVGYHNEHHDFPQIPWSRLPMVTELAKDHYSSLITCKSWIMTLITFICDDALGPHNRVISH